MFKCLPSNDGDIINQVEVQRRRWRYIGLHTKHRCHIVHIEGIHQSFYSFLLLGTALPFGSRHHRWSVVLRIVFSDFYFCQSPLLRHIRTVYMLYATFYLSYHEGQSRAKSSLLKKDINSWLFTSTTRWRQVHQKECDTTMTKKKEGLKYKCYIVRGSMVNPLITFLDDIFNYYSPPGPNFFSSHRFLKCPCDLLPFANVITKEGNGSGV